ARCHDHKFDPIPQTDYHALKAVFAGVQHGEQPFERPAEAQRRLARAEELRRELARVEAEPDDAEPLARPDGPPRRLPVNARRNVERFAPVTAKFVRLTVLATTDAEPCIDELEVFPATGERRNLALASLGTKATASGTYAGSDRHKL